MTRPILAYCVTCGKDQPSYRRGARGRRRCMVCDSYVELKRSAGWNAKPTMGKHSGKQRDSKAEADREGVLQAFANTGRITELVYGGPRFSLEVYGTEAVDALLEAMRSWLPVIEPMTTDGERVRALALQVERSRRLIGHYTPDATYVDHRGERVAEDVKGHKISRDFPLRAKLMEVCHNLPVAIIREQRGVQQYARGAGVRGKATGSRLAGGR